MNGDLTRFKGFATLTLVGALAVAFTYGLVMAFTTTRGWINDRRAARKGA